MNEPKVTIVVVPREQFSVTERSLQSVIDYTSMPYKLIYVDGNSPPDIQQRLQTLANEHDFQLLRSDNYLSPNYARNWALQHLTTEYVVFMDNDLLVTPGWLDALIRCAEETGAQAVGPLYLEGDPADKIIHMAGGTFEFVGERPHRQFTTAHLLQKSKLTELETPLLRARCDFVEFHCMLIRRSVFDQLGPLDEGLLNTREHLDLCLDIQEQGGTVYFEPDSEVTYRSPPPLAPCDRPFFLLRWSEDWTRRSLTRFIEKHGIDPSYQQRAAIAAARRSIVFRPIQEQASRIIGQRTAEWLHRGLSRAERAFNWLFMRGQAGH